MTEQEYNFVEQPSEDFFCPVTKDLLLQPHLTACCGHHLSDKAATKIQGEGGACPVCKEKKFTAHPDKYFSRQVHELRVFCRHKERGCGWEGDLSALEHHVQSCPRKNSPTVTIPLCEYNNTMQLGSPFPSDGARHNTYKCMSASMNSPSFLPSLPPSLQ